MFENEFSLRRKAEMLLAKKDKSGMKAWSKDGKWFLYINLVKPREDVHSLALEEVEVWGIKMILWYEIKSI